VGDEELHDDTMILVGRIFDVKTTESINAMLKDYKDIYYTVYIDDKVKSLFIIIKKQRYITSYNLVAMRELVRYLKRFPM